MIGAAEHLEQRMTICKRRKTSSRISWCVDTWIFYGCACRPIGWRVTSRNACLVALVARTEEADRVDLEKWSMSRIYFDFHRLLFQKCRREEKMSANATLLPIVQSVFSRWTALQLAVAHSMGGSESEVKYEAFIDAFTQFLVRNVRPALSVSSLEQDIQQYFDEVLDEEFNTELDDGSSQELAQLFVRYIQLIQQGKLADVHQELQAQQATAPAVQMSVRNDNEDDSSSSGSSTDDDDMREDDDEDDEATPREPKSQSMDVDEDGWVKVQRRSGGKK